MLYLYLSTHVISISKLKDLENLFPKRYWNSINYILVRFGRSKKHEDLILKRIKKSK